MTAEAGGPRFGGAAASTPGQARFVGRRDDLEALYEAMHECVRSSAALLVWVSGPPGIGKTRLVDELLSLLLVQERPLTVHRCTFGDDHGPRLWSTLIRQRFGLQDQPSGSDAARRQLDELGLQLTGLVSADRLDHAVNLLASLCGLAPEAGPRVQMLARRTAENLFRYDATHKPMLLVLEDVDRADEDDLHAAGELLAALAGTPTCAIAIGQTVVDLRGPGKELAVELKPLKESDAQKLVRSLLERVDALPDQVVATTANQSGGNPALAEELVRLLIHRGAITAGPAGDWSFADADFETRTIPSTMVESIRERARDLPPAEREALDYASILASGLEPDSARLATATGLVSMARAEQGVDAFPPSVGHDPFGLRLGTAIGSLVTHGVLLESPNRHGLTTLRFSDESLAESTRSALTPERRARLHRLAAQSLLSAAMAPASSHVGAQSGHVFGDAHLATVLDPARLVAAGHHLLAGERPIDAARCWLRASNQLAVRGRHVDATRLLQRAWDACTPEAAGLAADIAERCALAARRMGDLVTVETMCRNQDHHARVVEHTVLGLRAHLGLADVACLRGQLGTATEHAEHVAARAAELGAARLAAGARELDAQCRLASGEHEAVSEAIRLLETALQTRRRLADDAATARTLTELGAARVRAGALEGAVAAAGEALSLWHDTDDDPARVRTLGVQARARYEYAQHDEAIALWEQALALSTSLEATIEATAVRIDLAAAQVDAGRLDEARELLDAALETARERGLRLLEGEARVVLSSWHLATGAEARAKTEADRACELGYAVESRWLLGQALLARGSALANALFVDHQDNEGRTGDAVHCFEDAAALLREMGDRPTLVRALSAWGQALRERDQAVRGEALLEEAASLRRTMRGEREAVAVHEARTIRRHYSPPTNPALPGGTGLVFDDPRKPQ